MSASELVEGVLTDELLATFFVDPINTSIEDEKSQSQCEDYCKPHLSPTSIDEIRRLIISHFLNELPKAKGKDTEVQQRLDRLPPLLGRHRYEFLHPRVRVAAVNREELTFFLSKRIQEIWAPGSDLVVDETIVKFFGSDMIYSGNHMFIPHKPHPFGILLWGGATRASLSGLCFLFFWVPRYDDTKPTPTEAMRRIVRVAAGWAQKHAASIRVISDSAFRSSEMIPMCLGLGIDITASLSDNNKGPLPHIYDLVQLDMANGHCRTILADGLIYACKKEEGHITTVVSTIVKVRRTARVNVRMPYKSAIIVASSNSLAALQSMYSAQLGRMESCYAYGCALAGVDIAFPEPNRQGDIVLSHDSLSKLAKIQLRWMAKKLGIHLGGRVKAEIFKEIKSWLFNPTHRLPESCLLVSDPPPLRESEIPQALKLLAGPPSSESPHIDYYNSIYSLQDHVNRNFYKNTLGGVSRRADAVLVYQILYHALSACFVATLESKMEWAKEHLSQDEANNVKEEYSWFEFLFDLASDFIERPHHRPPGRKPKISDLLLNVPEMRKTMTDVVEGHTFPHLQPEVIFTTPAGRALVEEFYQERQVTIPGANGNNVFEHIRVEEYPAPVAIMEIEESDLTQPMTADQPHNRESLGGRLIPVPTPPESIATESSDSQWTSFTTPNIAHLQRNQEERRAKNKLREYGDQFDQNLGFNDCFGRYTLLSTGRKSCMKHWLDNQSSKKPDEEE
jgi:hypothetical protein